MTVTDFRRPSRNAAQAILLCGALLLAACAPQPKGTYQASGKSAVELRSMQTRVVPVGPDEAMRAVIETMQDLGYRITRVAPEARTVSGTRMASLRLAAVVQPRGEDASAVRANASIVSPLVEAQVDSPEFYARNFFEPLGQTLGRTPAPLDASANAPEAPRPVAELNTLAEREAAAAAKSQTSESE